MAKKSKQPKRTKAASWIDSVTQRAKHDSKDIVKTTLHSHSIQPSPSSPSPRHLLITRINFAGTKLLGEDTIPFEFEWVLGPGIWCIASHDNLVGKSTILEVVLWALRGSPTKFLQQDVREWIQSVNVEFSVEDKLHEILFTVKDKQPQGKVLRYVNDSKRTTVGTFEDNDTFGELMDKLMIELLGLECIPSWARHQQSEAGQTVIHSWPALSGALHIPDSTHSALLGEIVMGGLAGRLLQVFVGLPWAPTLMSARTAEKQLRYEDQETQRQITKVEQESNTDQLKEELNKIADRLKEMPTPQDAIQRLNAQLDKLRKLTSSLVRLQHDLQESKTQHDAIRKAHIEERQRLLDVKEIDCATAFFQGVNPTCCPRCDKPITNARKIKESTKHRCCVCNQSLQGESDPDTKELKQLEANVKSLSEALQNAKTKHETRKQRLAVLLGQQRELEQSITSTQSQLNASGERETNEKRFFQVQGMLEERERNTNLLKHSHGRLREIRGILKAAVKEADSRYKEAADPFFEQLSEEIFSLAKNFGMRTLQAAKINGAGQLRLTKGGSDTSFSKVTKGERLRLRVATIVGMLRIAQRSCVGRHPGLIILDSPGAEEVSDYDAAELVGELEKLTKELPHLQIILATARPELVQDIVPTECMRLVKPYETAW